MGAALIHPSLQPISQYVATTQSILEVNSGDVLRLTDLEDTIESNLGWSPDGQLITNASGIRQLRLIDTTSGGQAPVFLDDLEHWSQVVTTQVPPRHSDNKGS